MRSEKTDFVFPHTKNSNYVMLFECEIAAVSFDTRKI